MLFAAGTNILGKCVNSKRLGSSCEVFSLLWGAKVVVSVGEVFLGYFVVVFFFTIFSYSELRFL